MASRLVPIVVLLISGLTAQDPVKVKPVVKPEVKKPAEKASPKDLAKEKQDPGPTKAERVANLKLRLAKLQSELDQIQAFEKKGGIVHHVQTKLIDRSFTSRAIVDKNAPKRPVPRPPGNDAEVVQPGGLAQPTRKKATLFGDDAADGVAKDVIMIVDGVTATQSEFDALVAYYNSYPQSLNAEQIKSKAIDALVMVKAAQSRFKDGARRAEARLKVTAKQIADGADFAELAKQKSDCPSKAQGGDLNFFSRNQMDAYFTMESFSTKVGGTTKIFPSAFGYHIVKVTDRKAGDTPAEDKVRASHILALYDADQGKVRKCMSDARQGHSTIQFATQDMLKYAPPAYR